MSYYHITEKSSNRKVGNILMVTSSRDTCPPVCPFYNNGCYALGGPLGIHWRKISNKERGFTFNEFICRLKELVDSGKHTKIRLWQAGDFPGNGNIIDFNKVKKLVDVVKRLISFGYTHKPLNIEGNKKAIKYCNDNGVAINLSANNLQHADELFEENIGPVSVTVSSDIKRAIYTPNNRKVIICPKINNPNIYCATCGGDSPLCSRIDRKYIVGFPAHGNCYQKVNTIINS